MSLRIRSSVAALLVAFAIVGTAAVVHAQADDDEDEALPPDDEGALPDDEAPPPDDELAPDDQPPPDDGEAGALPDGEVPPDDGEPPDGAGAVDYPPEALELLPREILDQVPRIYTRFLRPDHYRRLKEHCPQDDLAAVMQCLDGAGDLLDDLLAEGVVASLVEYMDVELPRSLSAEEYQELGAACEKPGDVWGRCLFEHGIDADACEESEETLAQCLVGQDLVVEHYLQIVDAKKQAFGRDLYVEFAGLLALLPVDAITALRQACPQQERDAAAECFKQQPGVGDAMKLFHALSEQIVAESAKELAAAGHEIDPAPYVDAFYYLFLTQPIRTLMGLVSTCAKQHPELDKLTDPAQLDTAIQCIATAAQTDPVANPAYISVEKLREWLKIGKAKVVEVLRKKERAKQWTAFWRILLALGIVAAVGFVVVLLMPLGLRRRYPDKAGLLWKSSAVAAVAFAVTVMLLGGTLLAMRSAQGAIATDSTSPKMRIAQGAFDVLAKDDYVQGFSDLSKVGLDFIKGPLKQIVRGDPERVAQASAFAAYVAEHWAQLLEEPELRNLAKNVNTLRDQANRFKAAIGVYKKVDWVMGLVPIILTILAVLLYLIPLRRTLIDIASAPARAAASGVQQDVVGTARRTVAAELKSLVPFLIMVAVLLPLIGAFLAIAVPPVVELVLGFSLLTMFYILFTEASAAVLYGSLGGAVLLLITVVVVYILAMAFYVGTARRIFRARFHFGQPLGMHRRFWTLGSVALLVVLIYPVAFVLGVHYVAFDVFDPDIEKLGTFDMVGIPLLSLVGFWVVFWAARGFKALGFIKKYPVPMVARDAEVALTAAEMAGH